MIWTWAFLDFLSLVVLSESSGGLGYRFYDVDTGEEITEDQLAKSRFSGPMSKSEWHGGIPMGNPNFGQAQCDNGEDGIAVDWDGSEDEYTCDNQNNNYLQPNIQEPVEHCDRTAKRPLHICLDKFIEYEEQVPSSGPHRPLWPVYGEYVYLPPQRWLHSLEHGAIVFLYHPCADSEDVEILRDVVTGCLRKRIITPSKRLSPEQPFALVAYRCRLILSKPDISRAVAFIRKHAQHAPERMVWSDGQYSTGLLQAARMVSDKQDSTLCPQNN